MSDLTQKGYKFSLLKIVLENFSLSTLEMGFWAILFTCSAISFFTLYSPACSSVRWVKAVSVISHPKESLGQSLLKHCCEDEKTSQMNQPHSLSNFGFPFQCFDCCFLLMSLIVLQFFSHPPNNQYYDHLLEHIRLNQNPIIPSAVFYVLPYFTFNLVLDIDMMKENFLETSSLQVLMTLIFQSSLSELGGCRPECYLHPLTADLGSCYLTVTTSPFYNLSFQSSDAFSVRTSIFEDPETPGMVPATFSGASPFHTRLCPKTHNMGTLIWAFH